MTNRSINIGDMLQVVETVDPYFVAGKRFLVMGITQRIAHTDYQVLAETAEDPEDEVTIEPWEIDCFKVVHDG